MQLLRDFLVSKSALEAFCSNILDSKCYTNTLNWNTTSYSDITTSTFMWDKTPQGHDFWWGIYNEWKSICEDHEDIPIDLESRKLMVKQLLSKSKTRRLLGIIKAMR